MCRLLGGIRRFRRGYRPRYLGYQENQSLRGGVCSKMEWSGIASTFFSLGDAGVVDFCPFEAFDGDAECICLLDVGDGSSGFFVNYFPYPCECVLGFECAFGNLFLCCYRGAEFDSPSFVNPQLKVLPQFFVFEFMLFVSLLATFLTQNTIRLL
jgi:hypothetical protein